MTTSSDTHCMRYVDGHHEKDQYVTVPKMYLLVKGTFQVYDDAKIFH